MFSHEPIQYGHETDGRQNLHHDGVSSDANGHTSSDANGHN